MLNRTFGNRYQITEKIGMGGMAEVYKATDNTLGRTVAIKVMLPQYASDSNFAARFRQEAQSAANLSSPYIVNIYDWGRDDDSYYIAMEYVRGTDLKTAIQERGKIHPRKVAEIGSQVCSALSVAHGYDIIHRDIKSANIMVQADGNVKVMDFGIAQAGHPGMTQDSSVLGTAHYVSPEQAQGKTLTPASDLYSLGIVLYEAATGQLPFDGPDVVSVAMKQVNELPVPPRKLNPNIDPQFETIIMTALQKNPDNRFATAKEMQRAIDDYLSGRSSAQTVGLKNGTRPVAAAVPVGVNHTTVMPAAQMAGTGNLQSTATAPSKKSHIGRNVLIALLLIVIIAGAGIALAFTMNSDEVTVPNVVGQTEEEARKAIEDAGLRVGRTQFDVSDTVEKGKILSQDPAKNSRVKRGDYVNLVISSGKTKADIVTVPNLVGLTAAEAEQQLAALGLVGEAKQDKSDTMEAGKIFAQEPLVNSQVEVGSTVVYTISTGKTTAQVPNVLNQSESNAIAMLQNAGFQVQVNNSGSGGSVIDYSPRGEASLGSIIQITLSKPSSEPSQSPGSGDNPPGGGNTGDGSEGGPGYE